MGARTFAEGRHFEIGSLGVRTLLTAGHSPGQTSFVVTGLDTPLAIIGDSLFAASIGGSPTRFREQRAADIGKLLTLPDATVLASGHGPLPTVGQEKSHNPFFAKTI